MGKAPAVIYVVWAVFLIAMAVHIVHKICDESDPKSLTSSVNRINKALNEDP